MKAVALKGRAAWAEPGFARSAAHVSVGTSEL